MGSTAASAVPMAGAGRGGGRSVRKRKTVTAVPGDGARIGRIGGYPVRRHNALLALWTVVWFFVAERHTVTNELRRTYLSVEAADPGEGAP